MEKTKHGIFSIWKVIGFMIALFALSYKVFYTADNIDLIADWWGSLVIIPFAVYLINLATIATSFTRGPITAVLAGSMITASIILICIDGFIFLGFAAGCAYAPLYMFGFFPLANLLNIIASFFNLFGFLSISRREKKKQQLAV